MTQQFNEFIEKTSTIVLVGLGNPGREYSNTWHNLGFMFVDLLAESKFSVEKDLESEVATCNKNGKKLIFVKPTTFMNLSGRAVSKVLNYYKLNAENLVLIHDDLDINAGEYKISFGKGPRIHNGVNSVEEILKDNLFWRIRLGAESRTPETRRLWKSSDYVLSKVDKNTEKFLQKVIKELF